MSEPSSSSAVMDAVKGRAEERVAFLQELVRTPSVTGNEAEIQNIVETFFVQAGFKVRRQAIDLAAVSAHLTGLREDFDDRPNIIATLPGSGGGRSLLLNAHVDTVVAGDETRWTHPPFAGDLIDGHVWGRGSCDMKGGLVACLYAVLALKDARVRLAGDVVVAATVAEETGGAGAIACCLEGITADAAVVTEPTGLKIAPAHAGAAQWRLTLSGRSAHACVRQLGVSALEKFVGLVGELQAYERERNAGVTHPLFADVRHAVPLNVGVVTTGDSPTMVPERLIAEGRIGLMPGEDFTVLSAEFEERVARWASSDAWLSEHPPTVEWNGIRFLPSEVKVDHELVTTTEAAFAAVEQRAAVVKPMTYGTDMSHFIRIGRVPTLLFGPGDMALAHGADERVPIAQIHAATGVLAELASRWCGPP